MYQLFKNQFINPAHIAQIDVEDLKIVEQDGKKKSKAILTMSNRSTYDFTDEKPIVIGVVNELIAMVNTANNPFLSLPANMVSQQEEKAEMPKRIPSDGKGVGSHKVDPAVFAPDALGPDGFPLKDEAGNIVKQITPEMEEKQRKDAEIKKAIDEADKKDIPKDKTGQMDTPPELGEIIAPGPKSLEPKKKELFG